MKLFLELRGFFFFWGLIYPILLSNPAYTYGQDLSDLPIVMEYPSKAGRSSISVEEMNALNLRSLTWPLSYRERELLLGIYSSSHGSGRCRYRSLFSTLYSPIIFDLRFQNINFPADYFRPGLGVSNIHKDNACIQINSYGSVPYGMESSLDTLLGHEVVGFYEDESFSVQTINSESEDWGRGSPNSLEDRIGEIRESEGDSPRESNTEQSPSGELSHFSDEDFFDGDDFVTKDPVKLFIQSILNIPLCIPFI
jgi:hypothetical protein